MSDVFEVDHSGETLVVVLLQGASNVSGTGIQAELESVLEQVAHAAVRNVVIDFSALPYFGSGLLEALLQLWSRVSGEGKKMAVCNVSPVGRDVLRVSRFDTLWPICESRPEAIDAVE